MTQLQPFLKELTIDITRVLLFYSLGRLLQRRIYCISEKHHTHNILNIHTVTVGRRLQITDYRLSLKVPVMSGRSGRPVEDERHCPMTGLCSPVGRDASVPSPDPTVTYVDWAVFIFNRLCTWSDSTGARNYRQTSL